jgi:type IV pilus assembly protein PilV
MLMMTTRTLKGRRTRRRGFVMMEVLVGALIFAIGVLGLVALQANMSRSQTVGKFRGDAVYLADELVGMLWSDLPNRAQYATANCAAYARCNDWAGKVTRALPGGASTVAVNTGTGQVDVSISWTTAQGTQTYATSTAVVP